MQPIAHFNSSFGVKPVIRFTALLLFIMPLSLAAQNYSGEAAAVKTTVTVPLTPVLTNSINNTGSLPSGGGSTTLASSTASIPNVISIGASTVTSSGGIAGGNVNTSQSNASVATIAIAVPGNDPSLTVTADAVSSNTSCSCPGAACSGNSVIANLRIGGNLVSVSGGYNQTLVVSAGTTTLTVVINELSASPGSITVNALHITLVDALTGVSTSVVVASSHSDIDCAIVSTDRYSGRATGLSLRQTIVLPAASDTTLVSDTGFLSHSGGNIFTSTAGATVLGLFSTGVVTSNTSGGLPGGDVDSSQSDSTVTNLNVTLVGGVSVSATLLQSNTKCQCDASNNSSCSGSSQITSLSITTPLGPLGVVVTGNPNQIVPLPLGLGAIILNEQVSASSGDITVNALHVVLTPLGLASTDLVVAHSHSDIHCTFPSTAAMSTISGRVTNAHRRGISNVVLLVSDGKGTDRFARTNSFGYYTIFDVPTGRGYVLSASSKRYQFEPKVFDLSSDFTGADFTPVISRKLE